MKNEILLVRQINEEYKSRGGRITRERQNADWRENRRERCKATEILMLKEWGKAKGLNN